MDGFIYNEEDFDEQDVNFYRHFDRQRSHEILNYDEILLSEDEVDEIMMMMKEPEPQKFSPDQVEESREM